MKFLDARSGELSVLSLPSGANDVLDAATGAEGLALELGDDWYLVGPDDIQELRRRLAAGGDPEELLGDLDPISIVGPAETPSGSALVIDSGTVLGAWLPGAVMAREAERIAPRRASRRPLSKVGDILFGNFPRRRRAEKIPPPAAPPPEPESEAAAPPGDGGSSPEAGAETIERTPHMDAPEKIAMKPGTTFSVSVYADAEDLRPGEAGEGISLDLPPEVDEVEVGALIQLSEQFETSGPEFARLVIKRDEERSTTATFELRVAGDPPAGTAVISALLTLRGRSCGLVSRAWTWDGETAEASSIDPPLQPPVATAIHVSAEEADLSILITAPLNDGVNYHCAVQTPHLPAYREPQSKPFAIPAGGWAFVNDLLEAVTDETRSAEERLNALKVVGNDAWEAAPEIARQALWELIDGGAPLKTINVTSVEPVLPWELMIPRRFDGKTPAALGPLGTEFAIGRWTRADSTAPPPRLPVEKSFVVAPQYEQEEMKLDAQDEIDYVVENLRGTRLEPATRSDLDGRFAQDHASLVHFVCHGDTNVQGDDIIVLEEDQILRAREAEVLDGFGAMFRATHPFVFLNSCNTGRPVPSLAGGAGFPRSFGNLGSHGIVAPLWPVSDALAKEIALEIYRTALEKDAPPIAEILRGIRKRGYEQEDADTYAAYCFFGDPLARLELV